MGFRGAGTHRRKKKPPTARWRESGNFVPTIRRSFSQTSRSWTGHTCAQSKAKQAGEALWLARVRFGPNTKAR